MKTSFNSETQSGDLLSHFLVVWVTWRNPSKALFLNSGVESNLKYAKKSHRHLHQWVINGNLPKLKILGEKKRTGHTACTQIQIHRQNLA